MNIKFTTADVIRVSVEIKGTKFTVVGIYRLHSYPMQDFNSELTGITCQNLIILGDKNIDLLSQGSDVEAYVQMMNCFGLSSEISISTRVSDNSATLIDHIFVKLKYQTTA